MQPPSFPSYNSMLLQELLYIQTSGPATVKVGNLPNVSPTQDSQPFCAICDTKWCAHTEYGVLLEQAKMKLKKMRDCAHKRLVSKGKGSATRDYKRSQATLKSSCGGNDLYTSASSRKTYIKKNSLSDTEVWACS